MPQPVQKRPSPGVRMLSMIIAFEDKLDMPEKECEAVAGALHKV
jgi:hypothetical protein